ADAQPDQFADGGLDLGELGRELDLGAAHLARQLLRPAPVDRIRGRLLQGARQQVAHRLDHRIGQADVELAAGGAQLDIERGDHHDVVAAADAGELGVHFRADVLELDRIDVFPGLAVAFQGQAQQAPDDALFGDGEVPALDARAAASAAALQAVDHQEYKLGFEGVVRAAAQWFHSHQPAPPRD